MEQNTKDKIQEIINESEVLLFMKGTPVMPQCGFSAAVVGVLNHMGIEFNSVNVLEDPEIREGIKSSLIGQLYPNYTLKKNLLADVTLSGKCMKVVS